MKRVLALLLVLALAFALVACGEKTPETNGETTTTTTLAQNEGTTDESTTATTTTTGAKKTDGTTKATTTTTTTATKPEYVLKENTYFSYSAPITQTDYETQEEYYVILTLGLSFYPQGGDLMEGTFTEPVMVVSENTYHTLLPKYNCPKALEGDQRYITMNVTGEENTATPWEDVFEMVRKADPSSIVKHNGVEYIEFVPPMGGFEYPVFSYSINNETGDVTFTRLPDGITGEEYKLVSVTLKPITEKKLTATYTAHGQTKTFEMKKNTR